MPHWTAPTRRRTGSWPFGGRSGLPQAFAGRVMLHRRGLPSTLSLGVRDEGDGVLDFHAWLRAGGLLINWGGGPRQYAVLGTYHDTPGR